MTGIAYNPKATGGKKVESIDQLLTDPSLKGKVTALTEMPDTMGLMLLASGKDPANFTDADFSAAIDKLKSAVSSGQIRQFTGNDYAKGLASGDIAACIAWSGDVFQLQSDSPDIQFVIPDSGAMLWSDNMMIPNGANHQANAEAVMDYFYDPTVAATVEDYVNYICPVQGAQDAMKTVDPSHRRQPADLPGRRDAGEDAHLHGSRRDAAEEVHRPVHGSDRCLRLRSRTCTWSSSPSGSRRPPRSTTST